MTCQNLYVKHFERYKKQEIEMFNKIKYLTELEQQMREKNVSLENQAATLDNMVVNFVTNCGKKIHKADLQKTYLAQKKSQKAIDENNVYKLEKELTKLKSEKSANKDSTRLENEKLKESLKSSRILHKEQLRMKELMIADQNSTIKLQKTIIVKLE